MIFEWDEDKRVLNIQKHGVDFRDLESLFNGITVTLLDERFAEERFVSFGMLNYQVLAVAHTESDDLIRIISARRATGGEERSFFLAIGG